MTKKFTNMIKKAMEQPKISKDERLSPDRDNTPRLSLWNGVQKKITEEKKEKTNFALIAAASGGGGGAGGQ